MGNHEFCGECGASDFHYNRPCDPATKAKYQARQRKIERRVQQAEAAARNAAKKLRALGYEAEIDQYGDITIDKWSFHVKRFG